MKELYNDGHNRPDVKAALVKYIDIMQDIIRRCRTYYGPNMDQFIEPDLKPGEKRTVINMHDESSCHSRDSCPKKSYRRDGATGTMQSKSKGESGMVAALVNADDGKHF